MSTMQYSSVLRSSDFLRLFVLFTISLQCSNGYLLFVKRNPIRSFYDSSPSTEDFVERLLVEKMKRSAGAFTPLEVATAEDVCRAKYTPNNRPKLGHSVNGSRVEIQQDDDYQFIATYIECDKKNGERTPCHGIDTERYSSECITTFETRRASIRLFGTTGPYEMGEIKIPIMCSCKVRRINNVATR